jgi:hypothetical protein
MSVERILLAVYTAAAILLAIGFSQGRIVFVGNTEAGVSGGAITSFVGGEHQVPATCDVPTKTVPPNAPLLSATVPPTRECAKLVFQALMNNPTQYNMLQSGRLDYWRRTLEWPNDFWLALAAESQGVQSKP